MNINITGFSFDLFGRKGAAAGADLLLEEVREILADNRRERAATRAAAYRNRVKLHEVAFETLRQIGDWRRRGRQAVRKAWQQEERLFWLAGNHLGVLPVYDELAGTDTLVIQFDAHLDIHHFSTCTPELSHGNFLMHMGRKLPSIWNVGHRDLLLPAEHIDKYFRSTITAEELVVDEGAVLGRLRRAVGRARRVFVDIDCDVFDPVHFPAVAQPVPFGLAPNTLLRLLNAVWSE